MDQLNSGKKFGKTIIFLFLLSGVRFRLLGDFYVGELLSFFYVIFWKRNPLDGKNLVYKKLLLLWFTATSISNILNHTGFADFIKSSGSPIICLLIFITLTDLSIKYNYVHIFILVCAGQVIGGVFQPYNLGILDGWKYQYGIALGLFCISIPELFQRKYLIPLSFTAVIFLSLGYGSRSESGIFLASYFISKILTRKYSGQGGSPGKIIPSILIFSSTIAVYLITASRGLLGHSENMRASNLLNSSVSILNGRPEIFYSFPAFLHSPIFGYGGNPKISQNFIVSISQYLLDNSIQLANQLYPAGELPIHSYLFSALIYGGFFSGLFWIYYLFTVVKMLLSKVLKPQHSLISTTLVVLSLWNIFFSPFGASQRLLVIAALVFLTKDFTKK